MYLIRFVVGFALFVVPTGCTDHEAERQAEAVTAQAKVLADARSRESQLVDLRAERAGREAAIWHDFKQANTRRQLEMTDEQNKESARLLAISEFKKGKVSDDDYADAAEAAKAQLDFVSRMLRLVSERIQ